VALRTAAASEAHRRSDTGAPLAGADAAAIDIDLCDII
jgi:hypothetical protein